MKEQILSKLRQEGFEPIKEKSEWDERCGYEVIKKTEINGEYGKIIRTLKAGIQVKENKIIVATGFEENGKRHVYDPGQYSHDAEIEFPKDTPVEKIVEYISMFS
ncbi:MAG: hypothetical protein QXZ20_01800 [Candidatus Aenigmatarchaeota archaeon]